LSSALLKTRKKRKKGTVREINLSTFSILFHVDQGGKERKIPRKERAKEPDDAVRNLYSSSSRRSLAYSEEGKKKEEGEEESLITSNRCADAIGEREAPEERERYCLRHDCRSGQRGRPGQKKGKRREKRRKEERRALVLDLSGLAGRIDRE